MHSSGNQSLANTYVTKYIFSFQQHALYPFDFNIYLVMPPTLIQIIRLLM